MIEHGNPECTGSWTLVGGVIVCGRCGCRYLATPRARMAATDENCLDALLVQAAAEGADLLSSDRKH